MPYDDFDCLQITLADGVLTATMAYQPINLLDEKLAADLDRLGREAEQDEAVRVLVLRSAIPEYFIAHSGVKRVAQSGGKAVSDTPAPRQTQTIGERFRNMRKITIAVVEGRARGGGNEIALAMDMCFAAAETAIFGQPEVSTGLVPGGGSTQRLPRLVGRGRALEILAGCQDFTAAEAEQYGFINRALPADRLHDHVDRLARAIASFPTHTIGHLKRAVDAVTYGDLALGFLAEAHESDLSVTSDVTKRRVERFLELGGETFEGELDLPALVAKI